MNNYSRVSNSSSTVQPKHSRLQQDEVFVSENIQNRTDFKHSCSNRIEYKKGRHSNDPCISTIFDPLCSPYIHVFSSCLITAQTNQKRIIRIRIKQGKIKRIKYTLEVVDLRHSDIHDPTGNVYSLAMQISATLFQSLHRIALMLVQRSPDYLTFSFLTFRFI
jgi:hypothetical protein